MPRLVLGRREMCTARGAEPTSAARCSTASRTEPAKSWLPQRWLPPWEEIGSETMDDLSIRGPAMPKDSRVSSYA